MNLQPVSHSTLIRFGIATLLLLLVSFATIQLAKQTKIASAQSTTADAVVLNPVGATVAKRFDCTIMEVDEWVDSDKGSVLIGCNPGDGTISFFAQSTNDAKRASRILAIALTAVSLNKKVWIQYDPDEKNVTGCSVANCRMIIGMGMNNP